MRKLIILIILLCFPVMVLAIPPEDRVRDKDTVGLKDEVYFEKAKDIKVVEEATLGVFEITVGEWKEVKLTDRIDLKILDILGTDTDIRRKVIDGIETDISIQEKKAKIINEEIMVDVQNFADKIKPIDFGYQTMELNKIFLSVQESEKLKEALRLIPSVQYPIVKFPFLELTNDDPDIYWVDVSRGTNIVKMKEEIKDKPIKLAIFGVGNQFESSYNNFDLAQSGVQNKDFPLFGKEFEIAESVFKEIRPDIPIARLCVMHPSLEAWMASFTVQPDVWILFNCSTFNANWDKVKSKWFTDKPVITTLNFGIGNLEYGGKEYNDCIERLKGLNFSGNIWWRIK